MPSYRNRGAMAEQMTDLLRHYREDKKLGGTTANDILEIAIDMLWQREIGFFQPEPPAIVGWVRGRTSDGREGWKPQLSNGTILDEIDDDID